MPREQKIVRHELNKHRVECNHFWRGFSAVYEEMFMTLSRLIEEIPLENWFVEDATADTMQQIADFVCAPNKHKPGLAIVRGVTGSGKTTAVRVLFEHDPHHLLADNIIYFYIDGSGLSRRVDEIEEELDRHLYRLLMEKYGDAYFDDTLSGNREGSANSERLAQLVSEGYVPVTVWDNIDQSPYEIQRETLHLAQHKLVWHADQKIIVPVREYTLAMREREAALIGYEYDRIRHEPPPLMKIVSKRVGLAEIAGEDESRETVDLGAGAPKVTFAHGKAFLRAVVGNLGNEKTLRFLEWLTNYDLRMGLAIVRYALKTPYLSKRILLGAFYDIFEKKVPPKVLSTHRVVEGAIVGGAKECYGVWSFEDSMVANFFDSGVSNRWYNTLNPHHVAIYVQEHRGGALIDNILRDLKEIGHSRNCTMRTLQDFIATGIIWSKEGGVEAFPKSITTVLPNNTTLYYLNDLLPCLIYLQHMGLVTPLDPKYLQDVGVWSVEENTGDFRYRLAAARALLRQIAADEAAESEFVASAGRLAQTIYNSYQFGRMTSTYAGTVFGELRAIRESMRKDLGSLKKDKFGMVSQDWKTEMDQIRKLM